MGVFNLLPTVPSYRIPHPNRKQPRTVPSPLSMMPNDLGHLVLGHPLRINHASRRKRPAAPRLAPSTHPCPTVVLRAARKSSRNQKLVLFPPSLLADRSPKQVTVPQGHPPKSAHWRPPILQAWLVSSITRNELPDWNRSYKRKNRRC